MWVIHHVPYHALGNWSFVQALHTNRNCTTTGEWSFDPSCDTGEREIVADHRNTRPTNITDYRFDILQMLLFLGTVKQDVIPVCGIKVLDGGQFQARCADLLLQSQQFL